MMFVAAVVAVAITWAVICGIVVLADKHYRNH